MHLELSGSAAAIRELSILAQTPFRGRSPDHGGEGKKVAEGEKNLESGVKSVDGAGDGKRVVGECAGSSADKEGTGGGGGAGGVGGAAGGETSAKTECKDGMAGPTPTTLNGEKGDSVSPMKGSSGGVPGEMEWHVQAAKTVQGLGLDLMLSLLDSDMETFGAWVKAKREERLKERLEAVARLR
jgi:hypothetical protein